MMRVGVVLAMICGVGNSIQAAALHWDELPKLLRGQSVEVTTLQAVTHKGRFVKASADAIVLKEGKEVEIPRSAVSSMFRVGRDVLAFRA